jgi:hypothetical protein
MKRGSFDERVAKCLAQFRQVETRFSQPGKRLEINSRVQRTLPTGSKGRENS